MNRSPSNPEKTVGAGTGARKLTFWQSMRIVAWGFFGVRKNSGYEDDLGRANPLHVILAGVVGIFLFIGVLLLIVNWVVASA